MIRQRIHCKGRVQGVGFRGRCARIARNFRLTGWVKNEKDGSVTMEMQGARELIERTLRGINESRYIVIQTMEVKEIPLVLDEKSFGVKYE